MAKISKHEFEKGREKFKNKNKHQPEAILFDSSTVKSIVDRNPRVAFYFMEDEDGKNTIAIVGVDSADRLVMDDIQDKGQPCPPYCAIG